MFNKLKQKLGAVIEEGSELEPDTSIETKVKKKIKRKVKIKQKDLEQLLEDLELSLLSADVSLNTVEEIKQEIKEQLEGKEVGKGETIKQSTRKAIKETLESHLKEPETYLHQEIQETKKPYLVLFLGPNGHGKTTTIAKIAEKLQKKDLEVVLAAADTFRAASIEQLEKWNQKLDTKLIKHEYGSDPAAVCYDAKEHAESSDKDVVLIDTAGRSELDKNLMQQLKKIKDVTNPNYTMYVTEAVAGNAAVEQAKTFNEKIGIDGITITKTDTDTKGGSLLSISSETNKPIQYIGTGQSLEDLKNFKKQWFINKIIPEDE